MDFSAANTSLWNIIIQLGIIAAVILLSTFLRRKIPFIRDSLLPMTRETVPTAMQAMRRGSAALQST